jgi:phosphoglycolate phosphatase
MTQVKTNDIPMLKLIVFDCDGVMFDSKDANKEYYNHLLSQFNRPEMDAGELEFVHMNNVNNSILHIFRHYPDQDLQEVDDYRASIDYSMFFKYMTMEKDLIDFLEIAHHKYHLAISTNRTNTMMPLLKAYNLEKYFQKVMTAENAKRPKPAPDALLEILEHFNCHAEEAIYIGDSPIDRQHTNGCKMDLIAFKNEKLEAEYHVSSFMEIFDLPPFRTLPQNVSHK